MPTADARLTLLTFPQRWENRKLRVRALVLPKGNPLDPLAPGLPAFARASLSLTARAIPSLDRLPDVADALDALPFDSVAPDSLALYTELSSLFHIVAPPPGPYAVQTKSAVKKYLMPSYRAAFPFERPRPFCYVDSTYECALRESNDEPATPRPSPTDKVTWGQVIAFALRQPVLARRLGLLWETVLDFTDTNPFEQGGWLYVDLNPASDYTGQPGLLARYAARIPALDQPRPVFAAMLFPVQDGASAAAAGAFDDVFAEAEGYDDGFAKIVHGSQPHTGDVLDIQAKGLPVTRSLGIRLGWDDEQIVGWLNRQITGSATDPRNLDVDAPLGVAGYRVDVRRAGETLWHSLCRAKGPLQAGSLSLGDFDDELAVQAVPLNLRGEKTGDYWLPTYYATWAGYSLVVSDPGAFERGPQASLNQERVLEAVGVDAVPLRFGEDYEFRVRLADLTGGGPSWRDTDGLNPAPAPVAKIAFRRHTPPRTVEIKPIYASSAAQTVTRVHVARPRLGYPDLVFTGFPDARAALLQDAAGAASEAREPGVPDPDVFTLEIRVDVRDPVSGDYEPVYTSSRVFPEELQERLVLEFRYEDFPQIAVLTSADPTAAEEGAGPLLLPTARDVRVALTAVGRADPELKYFGSTLARIGPSPVVLTTRAPSRDERGLLATRAPTETCQAILLQPEEAPSGTLEVKLALMGRRSEQPAGPAQRLASQLGLELDGLSFSGRAGRRTVFGCSPALRHVLAPDRSILSFAALTDLLRRWLIVIRVRLDRDWTWDGLEASSFGVIRDGNAEVGVIEVPATVGLRARGESDRTGTELVFFDAIDPRPKPDEFPEELNLRYSLQPRFKHPPEKTDDPSPCDLRLPVAAAPTQTPKLVSAGIASAPFYAAEDYSATQPREQRLWLEFDRPPADPRDLYFARVLACAPDPMLLVEDEPIPELREPPLPIEPELIRVITSAHSGDEAALDAMQPLLPAADPKRWPCHFLVPLPPNLAAESQEMLGFFVYELRVGHDASRWCTAQGRFGPPLRVSGVQHPPPPLRCRVVRDALYISADAPYATPVFNDRNLRPSRPNTEIWVLLYVQVAQADGASRRNLLLGRARAEPLTQEPHRDQMHGDEKVLFGGARFEQAQLEQQLADLGLPRKSPLSVLAAELLPTSSRDAFADPLGADLGEVRVLRTSPLCPVPEIC